MGFTNLENTRIEYLNHIDSYIDTVSSVRVVNITEQQRILRILYNLREILGRDEAEESIKTYKMMIPQVEQYISML